MGDEEIKILGKVEDFYTQSKKIRAHYEVDWYANIAYVYGKQWLRYSHTLNQLFITDKLGTVKFTSNQLLPIARILSSKILKTRPMLIVVPGNNDKKTKQDAKVSEKTLQHLHRKLHLDTVYNEVVWNMIQTANYFLKPFWNPSIGTEMIEYELTTEDTGIPHVEKNKKGEDEQLKNSDGALLYRIPDMQTGEAVENVFRLGDVDVDVVSPFELFPGPGKTLQEMPALIHAKVRTVDYTKNMYGATVKPESISGLGSVEAQLLQLLNTRKAGDEQGDCVVVKEYWEKPSNKFKKGRKIVIANGKVLDYSEKIPPEYEKSIYPFINFMYIPVYGRFWNQSPIENLRPLQKEYNRILSDLFEHKNKTQFGKWLVPTTARISEEALTDEPAEVITYNPAGGAPSVLTSPPISEVNFGLLNIIKQDMYDLAGIHEVTHGKNPKGIRSGNAIAYLQEMDDTQLGTVITNFEESLETFGNVMLEIVRYHYKEQRLITIIGKDNKDEVESFTITGDSIPEDREIICQMTSSFPQHRIAKQQMIIDYFRNGIIDKKEARMLLDLGGDDLFKTDKVDEDMAKEENEMLENSEKVIAYEYQDQLIHLQTHDRFRNRKNYEKLPLGIKKMFEIHISAHKEFLRIKLQEMAQRQALAQEQNQSNNKPSDTPARPKSQAGVQKEDRRVIAGGVGG